MKNVNKKLLVVTIVALILAVSCVVGTFAYLAVKTDPVVNTFVSGDITLTLAETTGASYTMIPGQTIAKNPKVTVGADSEDCYVFVKIEESAAVEGKKFFDSTNVFSYEMDTAWTAVPGQAGVYYYAFEASELTDGRVTADKELTVIKNNEIIVKTTATTAQMDAATDSTLTITAYAVQKGAGSVEEAWAIAAALA